MKPYRGLRWLGFGLLTLFIIAATIVLKKDIYLQKQFRKKSFAAPTAYYASPKRFFPGQVFSTELLIEIFLEMGYRERPFGQRIAEGDFALGNRQQCLSAVQLSPLPHRCFTFRNRAQGDLYFLTFNEMDETTQIYTGDALNKTLMAEGDPEVFAHFLGTKPILQKDTSLGEVPRYCLDALLAIEDPDFLNHSGVSPRGTLRAILANFRGGWGAQGGSTITQQLVKNYFLTPEKTVSRKLNEMLISILLELRISKDAILERYLNIIYLGQQGVFEVRGFSSASEYYFNEPLSGLSLSQCALLAAILNNPGRYNPFRHPEKSVGRRDRVLRKMKEAQLISKAEHDEALQAPLPEQKKVTFNTTAPYFIDGVKKELAQKGVENLAGLNIYTTFDSQAQQAAQLAISKNLKTLTEKRPQLQKIWSEEKIPLEAALVSSNPATGEILALVGGRRFATSPYNRIVDSQRQVGSIFKPLVFLTALENFDENEQPYNPMTTIENSPFRYAFDKQVWEPRNYNKKFSEPVPLFYALKESMNVPTARLATSIGLDKIVKTAKDFGVKATLKPYPSLSLGAFEIPPMEVLQIYSTLAQMGKKRPLFMVHRVLDGTKKELYKHEASDHQAAKPEDVAVLVGMMKETLTSGTAASTRWRGFTHEAAGKTGTTSDTRDAWFAGFTPFHVAVVWVGFDKARSTGLTGASGALPIWTSYMKTVAKRQKNRDFPWPPGVQQNTIPPFELEILGLPENKIKETPLIFRRENGSDGSI